MLLVSCGSVRNHNLTERWTDKELLMQSSGIGRQQQAGSGESRISLRPAPSRAARDNDTIAWPANGRSNIHAGEIKHLIGKPIPKLTVVGSSPRQHDLGLYSCK